MAEWINCSQFALWVLQKCFRLFFFLVSKKTTVDSFQHIRIAHKANMHVYSIPHRSEWLFWNRFNLSVANAYVFSRPKWLFECIESEQKMKIRCVVPTTGDVEKVKVESKIRKTKNEKWKENKIRKIFEWTSRYRDEHNWICIPNVCKFCSAFQVVLSNGNSVNYFEQQ